MEKTYKRKSYSKPDLFVYGDVARLTLGNADGDYTDAAFPAGTPKASITFS
jgi:hypothetical protein